MNREAERQAAWTGRQSDRPHGQGERETGGMDREAERQAAWTLDRQAE